VPGRIDDATAALLEPFAVALHAVRKAAIDGRTVLIVGGGAIGQLTAIAARALGAGHITVSDPSDRRVNLAVGHGADAGCSPDNVAADVATGASFDVVFDASGHPAGVELALKAARPGTGHVVLVGNLPAGHGLPVQAITRAESWVTSTFRFSGGLAPALKLITSAGLDISWLVEESVPFGNIEDAFLASQRADPPLKVQISFPSTPQ
jgi:L-idonate 5-dehydrogenase